MRMAAAVEANPPRSYVLMEMEPLVGHRGDSEASDGGVDEEQGV
jgi:hypothetical protein